MDEVSSRAYWYDPTPGRNCNNHANGFCVPRASIGAGNSRPSVARGAAGPRRRHARPQRPCAPTWDAVAGEFSDKKECRALCGFAPPRGGGRARANRRPRRYPEKDWSGLWARYHRPFASSPNAQSVRAGWRKRARRAIISLLLDDAAVPSGRPAPSSQHVLRVAARRRLGAIGDPLEIFCAQHRRRELRQPRQGALDGGGAELGGADPEVCQPNEPLPRQCGDGGRGRRLGPRVRESQRRLAGDADLRHVHPKNSGASQLLHERGTARYFDSSGGSYRKPAAQQWRRAADTAWSTG